MLNQKERDSFRDYAMSSLQKDEQCQWADYTIRLLDQLESHEAAMRIAENAYRMLIETWWSDEEDEGPLTYSDMEAWKVLRAALEKPEPAKDAEWPGGHTR